jgi:hypothetical protein
MFKRLKSQTVNLAAIGTVVAVFVAAFFLQLNRSYHGNWQLLLAGALAITFFAGVFNYWRLLKMTEAPISTIAAAAQGYIELYGKAGCETPLKTPYQGIPCVWYRAWAFANRESDAEDSIDISNSQLLDYSESQTIFTLDDGTAKCEVNPNGAEVIHFVARTWRKNDHRYAEEYLPAGKHLYVIGQLDTRKEILDEKKINQYLREKLADWKTRPQQLLNRFDQNRDGQIDMHEWQKARQEAHECLLAEHAMKAHVTNKSGIEYTLAKPNSKQLFLISAKSPQELRDSHKSWLAIHLSLLFLLLALYVKLA